jgi:molecular chaperone GrpE
MLDTLNGNGSGDGDGTEDRLPRLGDVEDWRVEIEENFRHWLAQVEPRDLYAAPIEKIPDLYSFFEQLAALKSEMRKSGRRSHETFSRFGETLADFERMIQSLSARLGEERASRDEADLLSKRRLYLPLLELFERFKRMERRIARPPQRPRFFRARRWRGAWSDVREGFEILGTHFEALLDGEGIRAIEAKGRPFDPALMTAIDVRETDEAEPNTVVEEISRGYFHRGHVLKLAEVAVARSRGGAQ